MKRLFSTLIILYCFAQAYGQSNSNFGTLIIYREPLLQGNKFFYPVEINGQKIVQIKSGTYYITTLQPGSYRVSAKTEVESFVEIQVQPNDTLYVRCAVNMGMWVGRPDIIQVEKNSGRQAISSGLLSDISNETYTEFLPKGSIGVVLGGTAGFSSVDVFSIDNGKYSSLSPGGGFSIALLLTHRLMRHMELNYELMYKGAGLTPTLKNATAHFGKGIANIMIYGVAPAKGDYLRFKFGAGGGAHFGTNMEIDAKKVDGSLIKATYKPAFAFRAGAVMESCFNKYGFSIGIHLNRVTYKAKEATLNSAPFYLTEELNNANGSGLEFSVGYHFLF